MGSARGADGDLRAWLQGRDFGGEFDQKEGHYQFTRGGMTVRLRPGLPLVQVGPYALRLSVPLLERRGKLELPPGEFTWLTNNLTRLEKRLVGNKVEVGRSNTNRVEKTTTPTNRAASNAEMVFTLPLAPIPENVLRLTNTGKLDVVFIDPGHGGADPGALAYGFRESDMAMKVCLSLKKALTNRMPQVKVVMLREGDAYVTLEDRCRVANAKLGNGGNGLFLSIHLNTWLDPDTRGFEVYYMAHQEWSENARIWGIWENRVFQPEHTNLKGLSTWERIFGRIATVQYQKESRMIAENVHHAVFSRLKDYAVSRGVKAETFYVLKGAIMPSILVEVGFISSKADLEYLQDDDRMGKLTDAMAAGVEQYVKDFDQTGGFTTDLF